MLMPPQLTRRTRITDHSPRQNKQAPAGDAHGTGVIVEPVPEGVCPSCGIDISFGSAIPLSTTTCKACGGKFLTPGKVDTFLLLDRIGAGEMGEIYRAQDIMLNRDVAIKVVRAARAKDELLRERLRKEAQAAARLTHPNVAQVFALGFSNGYPYLVMELVGGEDMRTQLQNAQRIDEHTALNVARDIAKGLQALHEQGLTHGDIKPGNIVLDLHGAAKLVDFGLSGMARRDSSGSIVGTPHYIAPESLRGVPDNCQTDIYSLGATLYHLLSGRPPFDGSNISEITRARLTQSPDPIDRHVPDVSPHTKQIVMRMLNREPAQRYRDCAALTSDLSEALKNLNRPILARKPSGVVDSRQATVEPPKKTPALRRKNQLKQADCPPAPTGKAQPTTQQAAKQPRPHPQPRQRHYLRYAILSAIVVSAAIGIHYGLRAFRPTIHAVDSTDRDSGPRGDSSARLPSKPSLTPIDHDIRLDPPFFPRILEPQWISGGIGGRPGGSTAWSADGTLILQVSGSRSDTYRYIHTATTGDFEFSVLFHSLQNLSMTGLMVRESSDDYGPYIFFSIQDNGRLLLQVRHTHRPPQIVHISDAPVRLPCRLRIVRVGDRFQAASFDDGAWEPIAEHTIALPEQVRVGLAVSCQVPGMLGTAEFQDVLIRLPATNNKMHDLRRSRIEW